MKGLIKTSVVIAVIIVIGIGIAIIIAVDLNDRLASARERGFEAGLTRGYEIGFQQGSQSGYQQGSKTGYAEGSVNGDDSRDEAGFYFVYNPTYAEVQAILVENGSVNANDIHDYAETNGVRTAYVRAPIARQAAEGMVYLYELVAFETIDKGLIIVEPWSHQEVKVEVGKRYSELNGFPVSDYDDTITQITVVW